MFIRYYNCNYNLISTKFIFLNTTKKKKQNKTENYFKINLKLINNHPSRRIRFRENARTNL
jgi:hypothetical protein